MLLLLLYFYDNKAIIRQLYFRWNWLLIYNVDYV